MGVLHPKHVAGLSQQFPLQLIMYNTTIFLVVCDNKISITHSIYPSDETDPLRLDTVK
jgi:hypothetical protein